MSGYRIVLNLTGNASAKVATLSANLEKANMAASSLARSLASVAAASHAVKPINLGHVRPPHTPHAPRPPRPPRSDEPRPPRPPREPRYTRHRHTRILSYGTGFNIGGFSGRLSTILQPDANGNILGMNAGKLTRSLNIIAIVGSVLKTVGTAIVKFIAGVTIAPIAIGGIGLMASIRALQSESFAEGVRLISRRRQAQLGLGEDFERAQTSADFLSKSYGFDRSTTLSSINILTGMGVGGTARKLNVQEAAGLTKVGGLISQQSGVSFERVMTNIQQLLVQTTPHVRDIREMLNQAPILGKYALRDMEEKGVKGVDVRTWLKDQNNIMSAFKRYELDLASNAGMQARGEIALAQQDFWAKIADNKAFWSYVGIAGSSVIGAAGSAINKLLTSLANNTSFKVMIANIENIFDEFGEKGGSFIQKLSNLIDGLSQKYGIPVGDPAKARDKVGRQNAVDGLMSDSLFTGDILARAERMGAFRNTKSGTEARRLEEENYLNKARHELLTNEAFLKSIQENYTFLRATNLIDDIRSISIKDFEPKNLAAKIIIRLQKRILLNFLGLDMSEEAQNKRIAEAAFKAPNYVSDTIFRHLTHTASDALSGKEDTPIENAAEYLIDKNKAYDIVDEMLKKMLLSGGKIPTDAGGKDGSDLTGFNKDRKALEIHFHAPIVEWNNTMEATNPEETVEAVGENIERLASAAIQKALLGASQKMSSRWY